MRLTTRGRFVADLLAFLLFVASFVLIALFFGALQ